LILEQEKERKLVLQPEGHDDALEGFAASKTPNQ
jgi:hypothetical protein